jgi:hypothetical protein
MRRGLKNNHAKVAIKTESLIPIEALFYLFHLYHHPGKAYIMTVTGMVWKIFPKSFAG